MLHNYPKFASVCIKKIHVGSYQPRKLFDEVKLRELAASIAQYGILQPILIRDDYQIIAGERRWRAALLIGLLEVPCMIVSTTNDNHALMAILENIQREQMEPLEEALAYKRLIEEFSWTQDYIAQLLGKSRTHVTNMLRLLKLSNSVVAAISAKQLTYGHARVLVGLPEAQQAYYLAWIKANNCSVRQIEQRVRQDKKNPPKEKNDEHSHFVRFLEAQFGTKVEYEEIKNGEGWLKIKFYNQETLAGILEKLGIFYE